MVRLGRSGKRCSAGGVQLLGNEVATGRVAGEDESRQGRAGVEQVPDGGEGLE